MPEDRIEIDALLEKQHMRSPLATVERISDEQDRVKVTPYASTSGCLCHLATNLPKSSIEALKPTDIIHNCCGNRLMVVEVTFGETLLNDVFTQLLAK